MKDYYRAIALVAVLLVAVMAAWTQGGGSAPAAPPTKTGVLNVRQAIVSTSEGKQASAELQSQFSPRQNELENLNKQIEDVRSRLSAGARTLSDEEKTRLTRDGEKLARQLQRKQQELEEEVNTAQGEVFDRIGRKLLDVLDRYSRENGYSLVLDTSAQSTPVLYASSQVDVTQDIIRLYDQAYPVKGGPPASATPRQPAAPKPAPKPPSK